MKTKNFAAIVLCVLMLSGIGMTVANAVPFPNLPNVAVTLNNNNLTPYDYPFVSQLKNVPAGFDVSNGIYTGWCIDLEGEAIRGTDYQVMLYSSLTPPAQFAAIPWDMINYILNNKQGTGTDISQAIWFFINGNAWPNGAQLPGYPFPLPPSAFASAMVADALANGDGFVPGPGEVVAVICDAVEADVQDIIIELTIPREPGYTPGFWKHNIGVYLGLNPGSYSAFNDGTKLTGPMLEGYAATVGVTLQEAYDALNTKGQPASTRIDMANDFNDAAGYGPFED